MHEGHLLGIGRPVAPSRHPGAQPIEPQHLGIGEEQLAQSRQALAWILGARAETMAIGPLIVTWRVDHGHRLAAKDFRDPAQLRIGAGRAP